MSAARARAMSNAGRVARSASATAVELPGIPRSGLVQLAGSVLFFGSAWPLTKQAISLGASPLWFAEGRAVLSGTMSLLLVCLAGRLRLPRRPDLPAVIAIGLFQLAGFFALAHAAVAWVPAGRTAVRSVEQVHN